MIRRPPRSTQSRSSAASDVYKRQLVLAEARADPAEGLGQLRPPRLARPPSPEQTDGITPRPHLDVRLRVASHHRVVGPPKLLCRLLGEVLPLSHVLRRTSLADSHLSD